MTNIKELPIPFQTEMVQAVLEDRKTQTRRTRGLEDIPLQNFNSIEYLPDHWGKRPWIFRNQIQSNPDRYEIKAAAKSHYGKPGDLLWVRETFAAIDYGPGRIRIAFKADDSTIKGYFKWKPSIHMPKAAARIWLMVEDISVERLQDISDEEILSEGVRIPVSNKDGDNNAVVLILGEKNKAIDFLPKGFAAEGQPKLTAHQLLFAHWAELWCDVNGLDSWSQNPWVWAVKFRVLSKTGRPDEELIMKNWKEVVYD